MNSLQLFKRKNWVWATVTSLLTIHFVIFPVSNTLAFSVMCYFGVLSILDVVMNVLYVGMLIIGRKRNLLPNTITGIETHAFIKLMRFNLVYQIAGALAFATYLFYKSPMHIAIVLLILHLGFVVQQLIYHTADVILMQSFKDKLFKTS